MKNHLKIISESILKIAVSSLVFLSGGISMMSAQEQAQPARIDELDDMSFIDMLYTPELGNEAKLISKFQMREGQQKLLKDKYKDPAIKVELTRNKEVLCITIPASYLFGPNEIVLSDKAGVYLDPIKRYLKDPDMYRVLIAMHTDNTGSPQYRDMLTEERVDAVFDYFDQNNVDTRYLFSYALSDDLPFVENNSVLNRAKNRRLEIYLVPGKKMIEQAKRGRISF